jgi:hypothetical protein
MESEVNEPYRYTVDNAIRDHLNQLQITPDYSMRHHVDTMAERLSEHITYYCQAEDPLHIGLTQLSIHTNCIATEVLCVWWITQKEKLPIEWQRNSEQFRMALQDAIDSDIEPLQAEYKSIEPETQFPVTTAQKKQWIAERVMELAFFRHMLTAKAKPSSQKEVI